MPDIFERLGPTCFKASSLAEGPWNPQACHGGAPAALLAHAVIAEKPNVPMRLARLTVDLVRAVPIGAPLTVMTTVLNQGRRVQLVEAVLRTEAQCVARAIGLKLRQQSHAENLLASDGPDVRHQTALPGGFASEFVIVPVSGGFGPLGPADVWFQMTGSLVDGNAVDAIEQSVAVADFGSGISHDVSFDEWTFPSLDLTISFARIPTGSWTRLNSRWLRCASDRAICTSALSDLHGPFGHAHQTVLVDPRRHQ